LWGFIVGRPGTLKSPSVREGTRHLRRLAAEASERHRAALGAATIEAELLDAQLAAARRAAARPAVDIEASRAELTRLAAARAAAVPVERRYSTSDSTTEKLGELLLQHPRGLLLERDELAGWLRTLERPGREGDREFFLESWNGDGAYTVDRIGRGTLHIPALCLSILGTTQPGKLRAYLSAATEGGAGDDGLMQRFQLAVWPDVAGEWRDVDRWPDSKARDRAAAVYAMLDTLTPDRLGATTTNGNIPALRFDAGAQDLFVEWRRELEIRLRSPELGAFPSYEAHAAKYRSLMPALALHCHLVDVVADRTPAGPVTLDAARTAAAWVDFLDAHARRLYALELDPGRAAARALAQRIGRGEVADGEALRDIAHRQWSELRTVTLVRAGAAMLVTLGWLRIEHRETGGRPSEVVRLHPKLRGDA
jgi:putative DNA primase/helicase